MAAEIGAKAKHWAKLDALTVIISDWILSLLLPLRTIAMLFFINDFMVIIQFLPIILSQPTWIGFYFLF